MTSEDTHARILALAQDHMMRRGYNAFSYGDIARAVGVKPAAIHYYYPAKADLAVAVIASYGAAFDAWLESTRDATPAERLVGYFEIGRRFAQDGLVCPLSMVLAQQEAIPEPVVAAVDALQTRILAFYVEALSQARAQGQVRFDGEAADQAGLIACALIGAQFLARARGPASYVQVLRQQARGIGLDVPWPISSPPARERSQS